MKLSRLASGALTVSILIGLVGISYATRSSNADYDLVPRFEKGQNIEITSNMEITFNLDDAELKMGDQPFPMTPSVNISRLSPGASWSSASWKTASSTTPMGTPPSPSQWRASPPETRIGPGCPARS